MAFKLYCLGTLINSSVTYAILLYIYTYYSSKYNLLQIVCYYIYYIVCYYNYYAYYKRKVVCYYS